MYKIVLTATVLTAVCFSVFGQTSQGERFRVYSGSLSFSHQASSDVLRNENYDASLNYRKGRFVKDNLAHGWLAGIGFGLSRYRFEYVPEPIRQYRTFTPALTLGYFTRYYIPSQQAIRVFAELSTHATYWITDAEDTRFGRPSYRSHAFNLVGVVSLGAVYFAKPRLAFEARATLGTVQLSHTRPYSEVPASTSLYVNGGTGISTFQIGLARYFGGEAPSSRLFPPARPTLYETGQRYLAGSLNLIMPFGNPFNSGQFSVALAKFKTPNRASGLLLSGGFRRNTNTSQNPSSVQINRSDQVQAGIRPFRELYWGLPLRNVSVFVNTGLQFSYTGEFTRSTTRYLDGSGRTDENRYRQHAISLFPAISPGIQYQFLPKWALAATVGGLSLGTVSFQRNPDTNTNTFFVSVQPELYLNSFGLSLRYFPHRKEAAPTTPNSF